MAGQFTRTMTDVRNPVQSYAGVRDDSAAMMLEATGDLALEANAGIRAGMLRGKIEKEIEQYAGYTDKADDLAENYSDQTAALAEQTKEFQDEEDFEDPGVLETEQQFMERAQDLKQAHESGAISYDDLRLRIETHMRNYIASLPGEGARFRRVASEVLGDNEQRLKPFRDAEAASLAMQQQQAQADMKFAQRAFELGMTPEQLRYFENRAYMAEQDIITARQEGKSFDRVASKFLAGTNTVLDMSIYQAVESMPGGVLDTKSVQALEQQIHAETQQAIGSLYNMSSGYPDVDVDKHIKRLQEQQKAKIAYIQEASAANQLTAMNEMAKQQSDWNGTMTFGDLWYFAKNNKNFMTEYREAMTSRSAIFNADLTDQVRAERQRNWENTHKFFNDMVFQGSWDNEFPPEHNSANNPVWLQAYEKNPRTNMNNINDPAVEPKEKKKFLETILETSAAGDHQALEALALDQETFTNVSTNKELLDQLRNYLNSETSKVAAYIKEVRSAPALSKRAGPKGRKSLEQELLDEVEALRTVYRAYAPIWGGDAELEMFKVLQEGGATPEDILEVGEIVGSNNPIPNFTRFFRELIKPADPVNRSRKATESDTTTDTGQQDFDDIRRAMQRANQVQASGEIDPVTGNPIHIDTGASFRIEDSASFSVEEGGMLDEKKIENLSNVIGQVESRNNYNAHYGDASSEVPFTSMTINEVLEWQNNFVKEGSPSSAVGKYQIIRKTMRQLMKDLELSGDEKFDEAMQDKMFMQLLKKRGLDKYNEGNMSAEDFANNLAKEWASLPVVTGSKVGSSYYSGDGLNKALVSVDDILSNLI